MIESKNFKLFNEEIDAAMDFVTNCLSTEKVENSAGQ